jgi:uncharacterized phage protein (TIGR01671 family)
MERIIKFKAFIPLSGMMCGPFDLTDVPGVVKAAISADIRCHLMQFTGLTDKNGKDICEGDLVKYRLYFDGPPSKTPKGRPFIEVIVPVRFRNGVFSPDDVGKRMPPYSTTYNEWWMNSEVVGNLYENPELLNTTVL